MRHGLANSLRQEFNARITELQEARRKLDSTQDHYEWLKAESEVSDVLIKVRIAAKLLEVAEGLLLESPEIIIPSRAAFSHAANGV